MKPPIKDMPRAALNRGRRSHRGKRLATAGGGKGRGAPTPTPPKPAAGGHHLPFLWSPFRGAAEACTPEVPVLGGLPPLGPAAPPLQQVGGTRGGKGPGSPIPPPQGG